MTLIAAFRYRDGAIICADSQETVGCYRVEVEKIKPRDAGNYDLIIGGSGNIATLIDGQADTIERNVKSWPAGLSEEEARRRLETVLISYNVRHVVPFPVTGPADDPIYKVMRFIVCARDRSTSQIYLWKTEATTIECVEDFALVGWDEAIYIHEVRKLYKRNVFAFRCVMLGVHLFALAKATSNWVGGPTQVIGVCDKGMWVEPPQHIGKLEARMEAFDKMTAKLLLECADTITTGSEFDNRLARFHEEAKKLRTEYIKEQIRAVRMAELTGNDITPFYYDYPAINPTEYWEEELNLPESQ